MCSSVVRIDQIDPPFGGLTGLGTLATSRELFFCIWIASPFLDETLQFIELGLFGWWGRWRNFRRNGRAFWSLLIFLVLFGLSLFAEFIANDRPILVNYRGELRMPIFSFYAETDFGGDFQTEAAYSLMWLSLLSRSLAFLNHVR